MCWLLFVKLLCVMMKKGTCVCLQLLDWRASVTLGELRGHSDNIRCVLPAHRGTGLPCSDPQVSSATDMTRVPAWDQASLLAM